MPFAAGAHVAKVSYKFFKLWDITLRMLEMEKAHRKYQMAKLEAPRN